jgi:hydroxymethylbilane synthase
LGSIKRQEATAMPEPLLRLGTRGSALARWQAEHVRGLLQASWPGLRVEVAVITTRGDRLIDRPSPRQDGKGLFTAELETALRTGMLDLAVHSLKDLPVQHPPGLVVGAVPRRADPAEALVSHNNLELAALPVGATIGTSSPRRAAQLLHQRPDLQIADLQGNVDTRLAAVRDHDGCYDATVLARAGLQRLGRLDAACQLLTLEQVLPAPGQGALGLQCRDEDRSLQLLAPLEDPDTRTTVTAERGFLDGLGGGCALPISAHAVVVGDQLRLWGRVSAPDGSTQIDVHGNAHTGGPDRPGPDAFQLGRRLARSALDQGAAELLREVA